MNVSGDVVYNNNIIYIQKQDDTPDEKGGYNGIKDIHNLAHLKGNYRNNAHGKYEHCTDDHVQTVKMKLNTSHSEMRKNSTGAESIEKHYQNGANVNQKRNDKGYNTGTYTGKYSKAKEDQGNQGNQSN